MRVCGRSGGGYPRNERRGFSQPGSHEHSMDMPSYLETFSA